MENLSTKNDDLRETADVHTNTEEDFTEADLDAQPAANCGGICADRPVADSDNEDSMDEEEMKEYEDYLDHLFRNVFDDNVYRYDSVRPERKRYDRVKDDRKRDANEDSKKIWIFGYGSICWNPGFQYEKSTTGFIEGFSRKFWQGSITHRGTGQNPGRVATLVQNDNKKAIVWGRVFQVLKDRKEIIDYLDNRECACGGYIPVAVTVHLKDPQITVQAVTYVAYSGNTLWLGNAPLPQISTQIANCRGYAGHNVEYLLRLTDYMRCYIPEETDKELFALETLVMEYIERNKLCINELMGITSADGTIDGTVKRLQKIRSFDNNYDDDAADSKATAKMITCLPSTSTSSYSSRITVDEKLRCLNI